jgi:transposase-like protein
MGKRIRRTDFSTKMRVIQDIASGKTSINQAARELSVSPGTVQSWVNKFRAGTLQDRPSKREKDMEKEIAKLKETVGGLYMVIEELKKTADLKRRKKNADSSVITAENLEHFVKPVKQ